MGSAWAEGQRKAVVVLLEPRGWGKPTALCTFPYSSGTAGGAVGRTGSVLSQGFGLWGFCLGEGVGALQLLYGVGAFSFKCVLLFFLA